jgi:hypothetical protein
VKEPAIVEPRQNESNVSTPERSGIAVAVAEAEALKDLLRHAYTRTHQLLAGVKRYRKQAQAMKSALGSLRLLQEVGE